MAEPKGRPSAGTLIFSLAWLLWAGLFAWSWSGGEQGALGGIYYAARDALQPQGYAIRGNLRFAPSWILLHLAVIVAPAAIALGLHGLLVTVRRFRKSRS